MHCANIYCSVELRINIDYLRSPFDILSAPGYVYGSVYTSVAEQRDGKYSGVALRRSINGVFFALISIVCTA